VQRPHVERAAAVFGEYITTLDSALAATPRASRDALAARLDARADVPPDALREPPVNPLEFYRTHELRIFLQALRRYLPAGSDVRWEPGHPAQAQAQAQAQAGTQADNAAHARGEQQMMWLRVHIADTPYWIAMTMPEEAQGGRLVGALLVALSLGVLAALTGFVIQRHLNRPLQHLAVAARRVSAGEAPAPLPVDGPTEIAQVSTAFNQMMLALRQADATRALMLAGISHDIRTPLTKLRLAMAMAGAPRDAPFTDAAESYLDQIDTILQQFMDYAGSGEREAAQAGDLNALVSQLAADFAGLGHDFELSLADLPPVTFRPISMMRLLMNLMQNAVKYGRDGLAVRTWRDARAVYVAVGDRGTGLSAAELEALKAPFQRGRNAHGATSGTGLGLAIVERIARLHGGALQFHPREGGGLEVWVVLPP
jgi:two-component system osmolarity sensor histidine kinase EnvZ